MSAFIDFTLSILPVVAALFVTGSAWLPLFDRVANWWSRQWSMIIPDDEHI